jgi:hypothetical protein
MVSESERDAMRNGRICVMTLGNGEKQSQRRIKKIKKKPSERAAVSLCSALTPSVFFLVPQNFRSA